VWVLMGGASRSATCHRPGARSHRQRLLHVYRPSQRPYSTAQYECYEITARSETRKLARVRPARCPAWGIWEYGLKSAENGHLARANGAIDGPYCSPTWPSVFGRPGVSRWLVGVVGLGAELLQRPQATRRALLKSDWLRKTRGVQACFRGCLGRLGRYG
jgi:hypothetical protein